LKPWLLKKRVNNLSSQLADNPKTETTIDWNCLSESERQLLSKVDEIVKEYAPAKPSQDIIEKYARYQDEHTIDRCVGECQFALIPDDIPTIRKLEEMIWESQESYDLIFHLSSNMKPEKDFDVMFRKLVRKKLKARIIGCIVIGEKINKEFVDNNRNSPFEFRVSLSIIPNHFDNS
jgi:hypothetical protein